jgi:hypothetical protein
MNLSAEEIIALYKIKSCLTKQDKKIKEKIKSLQQELEVVREKLDIASRVSTVYKGVPLSGGDYGWCSLVRLPSGRMRTGQIYLNAHNNTTYGVKLRTGIGFHDEVFLGAGYSKKEANQIVLDFVISGDVIPESIRKYK